MGNNCAKCRCGHQPGEELQGRVSKRKKFRSNSLSKHEVLHPSYAETMCKSEEFEAVKEESTMGSDRRHNKKQVSLRSFKVKYIIGEGSYGKVYLVKKVDTGVLYAMKVLKKADIVTSKEEARVFTEKCITQSIKSPYITRLHYAFQSRTKLYFILDFVNGGDLFYHILNKKKLKEKQVVQIAAQILLGLKCLHENDIIYRDLKPMNILLDKNKNAKITDFGLSKLNFKQKTSVKMSLCGTVQYLAPEIALGEAYSQSVDWWSFGIILYEMICGSLPFEHKDKNIVMRYIVGKELKFKRGFSNAAQDLISGLLEKNPKKRLGAKGAQEIMQHEFFKSIDWEVLESKEIPAETDKTPRGYKKYCYGQSPKSSVISEKGPEEMDLPDFTFLGEETGMRRIESAL